MVPVSDHDLLIRIDERVQKLDRCMSNHLAHHWAAFLGVTLALVTAGISLCVALVRN